MINKLPIYPHPSFYLHSPPFGGVGGGFFLISNIVYKLTINRLFFYPHPSFYLHSPPFGGVGGGFWEEAFLFYIFNVLPTSSCPIRHQLSMEHSVDKRSASPQ